MGGSGAFNTNVDINYSTCNAYWCRTCMALHNFNIPLSIAITVLLVFPVLVPHTVVSTDKAHVIDLLPYALNTLLTTHVTDGLNVVLGHTPQFMALTLYPIVSEQTD